MNLLIQEFLTQILPADEPSVLEPLLESLSHHVEVKKMLYQYTAAQKYAWFLEKYPGLDEVIGDKYIASFLGVTPVTLSRSRKALGGTKGGGEKGRL